MDGVACVSCRQKQGRRAPTDPDRLLVRWVSCPLCSDGHGTRVVHPVCQGCYGRWSLGSEIALWEWIDGHTAGAEFEVCPVSEEFKLMRELAEAAG